MGGTIDGPEFGAPPMPWDIPCELSSGHFCDQLYNIPVPHTAEIRVSGMKVSLVLKTVIQCSVAIFII